MTQRQITHSLTVLACKDGHPPRLMLDHRNIASHGGYFVECSCSASTRFDNPEAAVKDWDRRNGRRGPRQKPAPDNVVQLDMLRAKGGV